MLGDKEISTRRAIRGSIAAAALIIAVLAVAGCVGVAPDGAPYDHGCAFNAYCPQNSGG